MFVNQSLKRGRSFVVFCNGFDICRAHYLKLKKETAVVYLHSFKKLRCSFGNFLNLCMNINLSVGSYDGPSSRIMKLTDYKIAHMFAQSKNSHFLICIMGVYNHYYIVRFRLTAGYLDLASVYQISNNVGKQVQNVATRKKVNNMPKSLTWTLCENCFQHTFTQCENCNTFYCSKYCQKVDWLYHKKECQNICRMCDT